jgi:hypothetical protein
VLNIHCLVSVYVQQVSINVSGCNFLFFRMEEFNYTPFASYALPCQTPFCSDCNLCCHLSHGNNAILAGRFNPYCNTTNINLWRRGPTIKYEALLLEWPSYNPFSPHTPPPPAQDIDVYRQAWCSSASHYGKVRSEITSDWLSFITTSVSKLCASSTDIYGSSDSPLGTFRAPLCSVLVHLPKTVLPARLTTAVNSISSNSYVFTRQSITVNKYLYTA